MIRQKRFEIKITVTDFRPRFERVGGLTSMLNLSASRH